MLAELDSTKKHSGRGISKGLKIARSRMSPQDNWSTSLGKEHCNSEGVVADKDQGKNIWHSDKHLILKNPDQTMLSPISMVFISNYRNNIKEGTLVSWLKDFVPVRWSCCRTNDPRILVASNSNHSSLILHAHYGWAVAILCLSFSLHSLNEDKYSHAMELLWGLNEIL